MGNLNINEIDFKLNSLITEVEQLAEKSTFPEKIDQKWIDGIIMSAYGFNYEY